ncbi:hypothetical protein BC833DRAFT_659117 [Globomyces pollinis-pini]|nr:hypothetical protein BC833DRAFT_659117 [Globomyces pollinis-pini]
MAFFIIYVLHFQIGTFNPDQNSESNSCAVKIKGHFIGHIWSFLLESPKKNSKGENRRAVLEAAVIVNVCNSLNANWEIFNVINKSTDKAGVTHTYGVRTIEGIPVENNTFNVHVMKGKVISMTSSFAGTLKRNVQVSPPKEVISLAEAVTIAEKQYNTPRDSFPHKMVYIQLPFGKFAYCYQFQLKDLESKKPRWDQVTIDSAIGQVVQAVNYVRFATFKVIPLPVNDQTSGKFKTVVNPDYLPASPFGWNKDANGSYTETRGNNVDAQIKGSSFLRVDGGKNLTFKSDFNTSAFSSSAESQKTAIINLFYDRTLGLVFNIGTMIWYCSMQVTHHNKILEYGVVWLWYDEYVSSIR